MPNTFLAALALLSQTLSSPLLVLIRVKSKRVQSFITNRPSSSFSTLAREKLPCRKKRKIIFWEFPKFNLSGCFKSGWSKSCRKLAMFWKPQPLQLLKKVRQYTSNLYGSTPPICIAVLSWLVSFEERETPQYAPHLYCNTPPICTAVHPPFVRQYFWKNTGGWGHRNVSEKRGSKSGWGEAVRHQKGTLPFLVVGPKHGSSSAIGS